MRERLRLGVKLREAVLVIDAVATELRVLDREPLWVLLIVLLAVFVSEGDADALGEPLLDCVCDCESLRVRTWLGLVELLALILFVDEPDRDAV